MIDFGKIIWVTVFFSGWHKKCHAPFFCGGQHLGKVEVQAQDTYVLLL